jgi:hypothetical protein
MVFSPEEPWELEIEPEQEALIFQPEEFEQNLSDLLETHGVLLNDAILAALNDASEEVMQSGQESLFDNVHEIAALFIPIYGPRIANRIEHLLNKHIQLGSFYINAIKGCDSHLAQQIARHAFINGHMIVEFLSIINPFFSYEAELLMFDEHITLENQQVRAYFEGEIVRAEELRDESLKQLREIAGHIAKSVERQVEDSQINMCSSNEEL